MSLQVFIEPQEHVNGRSVIGSADDGDLVPLGYAKWEMIPGSSDPPEPVRPSDFDNYETDTGVFAAGIRGARGFVTCWINPYQKNATKNNVNENVANPIGKPPVLVDNRGRVLDGRTQYPGQQGFRYDTNIPRPAYMTFSDLLDQEGVY